MDIHNSIDNWGLISIKTRISIHKYLLITDIHCRMSLHPWLDIHVDMNTYG